MLGQVFIRVDTVEVDHHRHAYMVVGLLGELGGLYSALTGIVLGSLSYYLTFSTDINYMMYMYSDKVLYSKSIIEGDVQAHKVEDAQQG